MTPSMIGAALMQDSPVPRADDFALIQCKPGFVPTVFTTVWRRLVPWMRADRLSGNVSNTGRDTIDRPSVRHWLKLA